MKKKSQDEIVDPSYLIDDCGDVPPADIVAYNELRSCADLFRMHEQGILEIHPDFQRDVVWPDAAQTRFIDSLMKQLPIPSMCFSLDYKTQKWLVIDGLQRLSCIIRFLKGSDWKMSTLDDISPEISGKSAAALKDRESSLHHFFSRVENLTIPITVLRCDYSKKSHMEYLFTIFHRLNSGGMKLNNQEIRNCIYGGSFNDLLRELDQHPAWRRINKMHRDENYRRVKQELILRFFAFSENHKKYSGSLAKFLNSYMQDHRYAANKAIEKKRRQFIDVISFIDERLFQKKPPQKLSITLLEALLIGIGRNIKSLQNEPTATIAKRFDRLSKHSAFSEGTIREGLSKKQRVIDRLDAAIKTFDPDQ